MPVTHESGRAGVRIRDARPEDRGAIEAVTLSAYQEYAVSMPAHWDGYRQNIVATLAAAPPGTQLVAAAAAAACIAALNWFFNGSRTGLALRAIANDQQVAMAVGINLQRHFAITWGLAGVLSVLAGTLWTFVTGGGFGIELVGLKVFPIVILGGLDSIPGTIIGAFVVGVVESLAAGWIDPLVGGSFSRVASYLVLLAALFVRPYGLFGRAQIERV